MRLSDELYRAIAYIGQAQIQPHRPPSPSKRSPTRSGTLALIPEEEETQQHQQQSKQEPAPTSSSDSKDKSRPLAPERRQSVHIQNSQNGPFTGFPASSSTPASSSQQQDPSKASTSKQAPLKMTMPPYVHDGETSSNPPASASPTFNSAPLKAPLAGQHVQAMEVRRHIYALQIPTLLLVNAELVKGCIFLLEQHAKTAPPNTQFSMDGPYLE